IVVVTPCSRTADGSPPVQVAPAETLTALSGPAVLVGGRALTPERCSRGSPQPPHLLALRTVRLRC
ncbi:MAG: hypothetical protein QF410_10165, partial [Planctomycetota bacterium]|nr:hypothetical protein [Planctomycetota bacterium]